MKAAEIQACIEAHLEGAKVLVETDDEHHFFATVIWAGFEGELPLARQRMVYAALGDAITSGQVHALSLKTQTPEQASK